MHRLGIVPQRLLREPFRVPALERPFCPGIPVRMQGYAWAERAKTCGYPERFAQQALGHSSKAVHRAYAKKAQMKLPSLEEYEKALEEKKVVAVKFQSGNQNQNAAGT